MKDLILNIQKWAEDRGILEKGTIDAQAIKTSEEVAELIIGISKDDIDLIRDSIGDVFVTLVIGALLTYKNSDTVTTLLLNEIEKDLNPNITNYRKSAMLHNLSYVMSEIVDGDNTSYWQEQLILARKVLTNIAYNYKLELKDCVASAYDEIKNRKGKMVGGVFVKESEI